MTFVVATLGAFAMIFGLVMFWKGLRIRPKNKLQIASGGLFLVGGACVTLTLSSYGTTIFENLEQSLQLGFLSIIGGAFIMWMEGKRLKGQAKALENSKERQMGGTPLDAFLVECVAENCHDFRVVGNKAKAEAIADRHGLQYPNGIIALLEEAYTAHEVVSKKLEADTLLRLKAEENAECNRLIRYSALKGVNKRHIMLSELLNNMLRQAHIKEKTGRGELKTTAEEREAITERLQEEMLAVKEKQVAETPADKVFALLEIVDHKVVVSPTGAVKVTAEVKAKNPVTLDGKEAVIDGTITAHITQGGTPVGEAALVLPLEGLSDTATIEGILLKGAMPKKGAKATFTPAHLWIMEK